MFERRLRIFLAFLLIFAAVLAVRAAQIQWLQHDAWVKASAALLSQVTSIETSRGSILDRQGRKLAVDAPCIDACVDYAVIPDDPDPKWLDAAAKSALRARLDGRKLDVPARQAALKQQRQAVLAGLAQMWAELARISGKTPDEIADIRHDIVARVQMQKRYLWWWSYERAAQQVKPLPWYRRIWSRPLNIDNFMPSVADEVSPQVIFAAIDPQTQARIARLREHFPMLSLQPDKHRVYPFARTACHVLGHLGRVNASELEDDPLAGERLRRYQAQDLIGRTGIEALCETTLRGSRGWVDRPDPDSPDAAPSSVDPVPGKNVKLSLDIELNSDVETAITESRTQHTPEGSVDIRADQHAAAVVIGLRPDDDGQVLAMASNPGYDPNLLDDTYEALSRDDLNLPLMDRATQLAVEPGSTIKVVVGAGSIADGVMTPTSTIQCHGVLIIDGREQPHGHCWVYALKKLEPGVVPSHNAAARDNALPNDMLTITDGLERSCNVVFETIADRMGMTDLCRWYDRFGLGRLTGIGIEESPGRLFRPGADARTLAAVRPLTWAAGIGQGVVHATPIQMANVAATIARGGIWERPQLVSRADIGRASTRPDALADMDGPDRVDLHLPASAIESVQRGMFQVCNGEHGTGHGILPSKQEPVDPDDPLLGIHIAGKTGTAQVSPLSTPRRDARGQLVRDESGKVIYDLVPLGAPGTASWYKSADNRFQHAWMIGYAPAEHPEVAFCVLVEYGEAGGRVAGAVAHDVLVACVRHGYLSSPARLASGKEAPKP